MYLIKVYDEEPEKLEMACVASFCPQRACCRPP